MFYVWSCVVALYQIIDIVQTPQYQKLYGNDPLAAWQPREQIGGGVAVVQTPHVENVKFYPSPDFTKYSPKKIVARNTKNIFYVQQGTPSVEMVNNNMFSREFNDLQNRTMKRKI